MASTMAFQSALRCRRTLLHPHRSFSGLSTTSSGSSRFNAGRAPFSNLLANYYYSDDLNDRQRQRPQTQPQRRAYHATTKREIVPIIGAAALLLIARYSYRALNRMEAEWDDYQWQLQQYERRQRQHGGTSADSADDEHSIIQTMAIDLGTVYSKIASSHVGTTPQAQVIVSREGDRYFFNGVVLPSNGNANDEEDTAIRGRKALERFFFPEPGQSSSSSEQEEVVQLPWEGLLASNPRHTERLVTKVLSPVLEETMERLESKAEATRFVITVPTLLAHTNPDHFRTVFANISPESILVPDPVAAVWGAQTKHLLPLEDETNKNGNKVLVVDIGGYLTQMSIVQKDKLQSSLVFPWGGETIVEKAVQILRQQAPEPVSDQRGLSAIQVQARTAVSELSTQIQVPVHVHYIFATPGKHHLDTTLSRSVVEQAVQSEINDLATADDMGSLSRHIPTPTNLETLFLSMVTELLEQNQEIPVNVDNILLVGGTSKFPLVRSSLLQAMSLLMPADEANRKLVHDTSLAPELCVLGAANILPAYNYDMQKGLVRNEPHP